MKKGGIETIIAAVILVGIVAALLISVINSSKSGKGTLDAGVGGVSAIEGIGMDE